MSNSRLIPSFIAILTSALVGCAPQDDAGISAKDEKRPNLLLIIIDDQNDLVSALGHPDSETPNIDRLAKRATLFTNAYCTAPACGPSRASFLTGLLPSTSGVYYNSQPNNNDPREWMRNVVNLPLHFKNSGYTTGLYGKVFHAKDKGDRISQYASEGYFSEHTGFWANITDEVESTLTDYRFEGGSNFAWGPIPDDWEIEDRKLIDTENADLVVEALQQDHNQPFLFTLGFLRPHLPWVAPQRFFDKYPLEDIQIPAGYLKGDLEDLPECAKWMARQVPGHTFGDSYLQKVIEEGQDWKRAIQAYKASMSHMDNQLGRVLDALERSPHADNTIVVVISDHGYHLGEKEHWTKFGLWEQTARIPFLVALPGQEAKTADTPVGLIDLYPTLVSLCGINPPDAQNLEGVNLAPIAKDPSLDRGRPVLSTYGYQNHALRGDRFRYIRYRNGDEELYDHNNDPHEFDNLAPNPDYDDTLAAFRAQLPKVNTPESDTGSNLGWDPKVFDPGYVYSD